MHKILTYMTPIALAAALVATNVSAEQATGSTKPSTQLLADSCAACHGTDGFDDIDIEKFLKKMKKYKYEDGKGRIMGPITRGISDDQIEALAKHFQTFNR